MRILVFAVSLLSVASLVSATYSTKIVENHVAYAHSVSFTFAKGDSGEPSGWRECEVKDGPGREIGIVCEGTRSIDYQSRERMNVNYYCEFHFDKLAELKYSLESQVCQ